jgi:hypothetical protein
MCVGGLKLRVGVLEIHTAESSRSQEYGAQPTCALPPNGYRPHVSRELSPVWKG